MDNERIQIDDKTWITIIDSIFYITYPYCEGVQKSQRFVLNMKRVQIDENLELIFFNENKFALGLSNALRLSDNNLFLFRVDEHGKTSDFIGYFEPYYKCVIKRFFQNYRMCKSNNKSIHERRLHYKKQIINERTYSKFIDDKLIKEKEKNTKLRMKLNFLKQRFLDQFQEIECPICLENKEAQFLDCCHTVCIDCYDKIDVCPLCRN